MGTLSTCLSVYVNVHEIQKGKIDSLELELSMVVNCYVVVKNPIFSMSHKSG